MSDDELYMLGYASAALESILASTSLIEAQARAAFALEEILDAGLDIPAKDERELRAAIAAFDIVAAATPIDELAEATRHLGDAAEVVTQTIHDKEKKR